MECAICFEKFFIPTSQEELEKMYKENVKNNQYNNMIKFTNLLITSKNNRTHTCSTQNCECIICGDCWFKITNKDDDDIPSKYNFTCPYCRNIDWKHYMNNVFGELRYKLLNLEEIYADLYHT
jgi:hypothetical protein